MIKQGYEKHPGIEDLITIVVKKGRQLTRGNTLLGIKLPQLSGTVPNSSSDLGVGRCYPGVGGRICGGRTRRSLLKN